MLLDPYIEVLVGFAPKSMLSDAGWQIQDALRITLVDRFWPNDNSPESLTRKYALEEEMEERLKKDCQVTGEQADEKSQVMVPSRPTDVAVEQRIGDRASISWFAWLVNAATAPAKHRKSLQGTRKVSKK
jgi:hypothetical protein